MRKLFIFIFIILCAVMPVSALELEAPTVPDSAEAYMTQEVTTFGEDLWTVIKAAIRDVHPAFAAASRICLSVIAVILLVSIVNNFNGSNQQVISIVGTLSVGMLLLQQTNAMILLGAKTITELSDYGKLLLPVMTAAMTAQGGVSASASLYMGTALFDSILTSIITDLMIPLLYVFICFSIAKSTLKEPLLKDIHGFSKWSITWPLKMLLYIFIGYMSITGVVSGTTDAVTLKAAKLTIAGMVPVVGNILSDASESVIVGAGLIKNSIGTYGLLAIIAIYIGPFLKIGVQYIFLKITSALCILIDHQGPAKLIEDFSTAMGLLLAMTGTVCLLLLISTVCFMKGVF